MASHVLVADTERATADLVAAQCARAAIDCVVVRDGAAAQSSLLSQGAPTLLITELALPRRNGFAILGDLRGLEGGRDVVAIVVSSFPQMLEMAERMRGELGPMTLLRKPLGPGVLRSAMAAALLTGRGERIRPAATDPGAERTRLAHLDALGLIDDAEPPRDLQSIVEQAARDFNVPVALISLVLDDRQWFKAHVGLTGALLRARGSPRDWSFCAHVVEGGRPLIVDDARNHPVFSQNPLVLDGTVVGYAGAPVETVEGDVLGTLCLIDRHPLELGSNGMDRLVAMAQAVAGRIALRECEQHLGRCIARLSPSPPPAGEAPSEPQPPTLAYLEVAMAHLDIGIFLLDSMGRVVVANHAAEAYFGLAPGECIRASEEDLVERLSRRLASPKLDRLRLRAPDGGPTVIRTIVEVAKPKRRVLRWKVAPLVLPNGPGRLVTLVDVTAEADLLRERELLASADSLTGLFNRRAGEETLAREEARAQRHRMPLSVVLIDLDHFKQINDGLGHAAGDSVLRRVGSVLRAGLRTSDIAVRWGGEEFLAILPSTTLEGASGLAERLRASVEQSTRLDPPPATFSAGVAELQPGERALAAVQRADEALYAAKRAGGNRVARA